MEFDNQRPIWLQITEYIRQGMIAGTWKQGDKLPSVREWALELKVNPNTMVKALAQLEREGLIVTRRGAGKYVAATSSELLAKGETEALELTERYLTQMRQLGCDDAQIAALLRQKGMKA
ncbi:GntR family transcriptional regulator [uncultured Faecalibaculum sp.]|uniref:GntR family transcriptional regulator n=1 Tax=uncultured Faecalibaculum sp. TaxID=1729681 RepID=UPI0025CF4201|nr:GntR family transcriptional regulator [uncultured Faecalibaculum sp.]